MSTPRTMSGFDMEKISAGQGAPREDQQHYNQDETTKVTLMEKSGNPAPAP